MSVETEKAWKYAVHINSVCADVALICTVTLVVTAALYSIFIEVRTHLKEVMRKGHLNCVLRTVMAAPVDPGGCALKCIGLKPFECCDLGFEFR